MSSRTKNSHRGSARDKQKAGDLWDENIHFTQEHEDPEDAQRLFENAKHVNDHDKFIEYIRHVESKSENDISHETLSDQLLSPRFKTPQARKLNRGDARFEECGPAVEPPLH